MGRRSNNNNSNSGCSIGRCGDCPGCLAPFCGKCAYCLGRSEFGTELQICVNKRCHTFLARKLMSASTRYKKPCQQCSFCLDKKERDCGTCWACLDKLHFDGEHLPGSICFGRKCKHPIWSSSKERVSSEDDKDDGDYVDSEDQDSDDSPPTSVKKRKLNFRGSDNEGPKRKVQKLNRGMSKYQLNLKKTSNKKLIKYRKSVLDSTKVVRGRLDRLKAKFRHKKQLTTKCPAVEMPEDEEQGDKESQKIMTAECSKHSPTKVMDNRKFLDSLKRPPKNGVEKLFRRILDRNSTKDISENDSAAESLSADDILDRLLRKYAIDCTVSPGDVLNLFYSLPCADLVNGLPLDKLDSLSRIKNDAYVIKPLSIEPVTAVEQPTQNYTNTTSPPKKFDHITSADPVLLGYIISLDKDQLASLLTGSTPKSLAASGSVPNLHYNSTASNSCNNSNNDQKPNSSSLNFNSSLIASQLQQRLASPQQQQSPSVLHQSFSSDNMQLQLKLLQMHQQHHNYAASGKKM